MSINETPSRGRPKSGNALSNAEKQRAYRERKKSEKTSTVQLDLYELAAVVASLTLEIDKKDRTNPRMVALRDRLSEQWHKARAKDPE